MIMKWLQFTLKHLGPLQPATHDDGIRIIDGVVYDNDEVLTTDEVVDMCRDGRKKPISVPCGAPASFPSLPPPPEPKIGDLPTSCLIVDADAWAVHVAGFVTSLQARGRSSVTVLGYRSDLRFWFKFATGLDKSVFALGHADIARAITALHTGTARRRLAALRQFAKNSDELPAIHLSYEASRAVLPAALARSVAGRGKVDAVKIRDEARQLCEDCDRAGVWLGLMLLCGLRVSEISSVTTGPGFVQIKGRLKTTTSRRVPAPAWLLQAMATLPAVGRNGYCKRRQRIDQLLRLRGYSNLHSLRHTYAKLLLAGGRTLTDVQYLLGHASIITTNDYMEKGGEGDVLELD